MGLSPQWLDELRARTTLSALIGRSIKVTKAGREYKACCPFHNEKTPSFTINDEKGFYHCFGCGAHGDAIRWMTDQRGLGFMDAVKELADTTGMQVPAADPQAAKQAEQRAGLHDVMQAAQDWFVQQLGSIEGAGARSYLERRGLTEQTIRDFGFGFAPDSRGRLKDALKSFGDDLLVDGGLLIKVDDKEPYDRFRGRLMIPIRDARGRVIAFGGRILGEGEPKYLNSPDTPLFDKGRTLYNLDKCSPASRNTGRVIVVEGYMDVIALAQAGFPDAVAPLGTALTEQQIQMLWRMTEKPILCFDGDNAGQKAAERAALRALPLLEPGKSLKFLGLPEGKDPDDILRAEGSDSFGLRLSKTSSFSEFLWVQERRKMTMLGASDPDDRAALLSRLEKLSELIGARSISKEYSRSLRSHFYDEFGFNKERMKRLGDVVSQAITAVIEGNSDLVVRAVLFGLSRYPASIRSEIENIAKLRINCDVLEKMRSILIEAAIAEPNIEQDMIEQLWVENLIPDFKPRDLQTDLVFSFYYKHKDHDRPRRDLHIVIKFILNDAEIRDQIAIALDAARKDVTEETYGKYLEAENRRTKLFQWFREEMDKRQIEIDQSESREKAA